MAQQVDSAAQPDSQIDEVDVTSRKQSALDAEAISLSDTPDAEPSVGGKTSIVIGAAARVAPVYEGSKTTKASPFPYIDVHGLFHDRVFISDIRGLGINIVDTGAFRTGVAFNDRGGRTSSDSPRLRGLPDIGSAASVAGFMTYSVKPFAFEFKVQRELGSRPGTEAEFGASFAMAPTPRWHVSVGTQLNWHDRKYNQKYFGVTAAEADDAIRMVRDGGEHDDRHLRLRAQPPAQVKTVFLLQHDVENHEIDRLLFQRGEHRGTVLRDRYGVRVLAEDVLVIIDQQ